MSTAETGLTNTKTQLARAAESDDRVHLHLDKRPEPNGLASSFPAYSSYTDGSETCCPEAVVGSKPARALAVEPWA